MGKITKKEISLLENYEKNCNEIADWAVKKYFGAEWEWDVSDWTGGEVGGILSVGDYYFSFSDFLTALEFRPTEKQFFDYYDLSLEKYYKKETFMNFKNFILYYKTIVESNAKKI